MYVAIGSAKCFALDEKNTLASTYGGTGEESEDHTSAPISDDGLLQCMRRSPCGHFFATCTSSKVYLWSFKPTALITIVERTADNLDECGDYFDLIWRPDSSAIALMTRKNFIHVYMLSSKDPNVTSVYDYEFEYDHHYALGPGQQRGVPNHVLRFTISIFIEQGITCALGLKNELVVGTKQKLELISLTWFGGMNIRHDRFDQLMGSIESLKTSIRHMEYNRNMDIFVLVLSDDSIFLSFQKDFNIIQTTIADNQELSPLGPDSRKLVHFYCIEKMNGGQKQDFRPTVTAVNPRFRLIAFGTMRGDVCVYHLNDEFQLVLSHKLEYASLTGEGVDTKGPVSALSWSSDGCAIAVGWLTGGISIWSTFGRLILHVSSSDLGHSAFIAKTDSYVQGVKNLFWGPGNYELFVLPSCDANGDDLASCIYSIPFAKYSLLTCQTRDNMRAPSLLANDRLYLYAGADIDISPTSSKATIWQALQVPNMYLAESWPLRYSAVSSDSRRLAVAGKRGFIYCHLASGRWRMFGNQVHEKSFMCLGGLAWYKDLILVACQDCNLYSYELRIYPCSKNLDNSSILFTEKFEKMIVLMNVLLNHLIVYTADNIVHHYSMSWEKEEFTIESICTIDLNDTVKWPMSVQYLDWFVPVLTDNVDECILSSQLLVLQEGKLGLYEIAEEVNGPWAHHQLCDQIEFCWPFVGKSPVGEMFNAIWAFDGSSVKVWMNLLLEKEDESAFRWTHDLYEEPLTLSFDFHPLSVLFHKGIIVGVEQHVATHHLDGIMYKSLAKTYLFLHHIVHFLLSKRCEREALSFAAHYEQFEYFGHSMEILLHRVLEEEAETFIGFNEKALLPLVVRLLKHFDQFHEVIVRCARKTEVSMWEYLFSIVGDPKSLFTHCLESGHLKTATSYLIILQTLEPFSVSSKLQVDLLEKTLEQENFELCSEIVRYLTSVETRLTAESAAANRQDGSRRGLLAISTEEEQTFYIDILISRHARKLMLKHRLRTLGKLASTLNFPLVDWLRKERHRTAVISDMPKTFKDLHDQFEWRWPGQGLSSGHDVDSPPLASPSPFLSPDEARRRSSLSLLGNNKESSRRNSTESLTRSSSSISDAGDTTHIIRKRSQSFLPDAIMRRLLLSTNVEKELRYLMKATFQSKNYGWAVLLATMLQDLGCVLEAARAIESEGDTKTLHSYRETIRTCGSLEYVQFLGSLEELMSLAK